ncbi:MAG: tryptophan--tRNA ligase, partial [Bacteroidia bacterium]|nr:tryptophan--tRNA ligase [Bacteroidia bacterium]
TVVSGIRPTGMLHLGNYFGAVKNFLRMQNEFNCYFFIADYHSLTTHPNPADLHGSVKRVLAEYIAMGLDPDKCTLFLQSDLSEIAELYLFLNMNAYMGELEKVPTFKDKVRTQPENVNAGLLTYPTLMAADILIHKGVKVPVGKDQEQHLEMARNFAKRFNHLYKVEYFPEPQPFNYNNSLIKIPGLSGAGKMSKSAGDKDCIYMSEPADSLLKKIKGAVTDAGPTLPNSPKPESIQNIFELMGLVSATDTIAHFEEAWNNCSIRYGDMKAKLAEDMESFIAPIRLRINDTINDDALLSKIAAQGAEKARASASETIKEVREIIGFRKFA